VYEDLYGPAEAGHLYADDRDLVRLLEHACTTPHGASTSALRERLETFDWRRIAPRFDARFATLTQNAPSSGASHRAVDD